MQWLCRDGFRVLSRDSTDRLDNSVPEQYGLANVALGVIRGDCSTSCEAADVVKPKARLYEPWVAMIN